ncbi:hypothetical protein Q4R59_13800 [Morganella morganii]|uniref:hypothetical protein n=1 Tax=Morganella morganii TaxID=582 RepID=UPI002795E582|nr:hypothetical protein [Morganella morganii]WLV38480.1 hypothetical protein M2O45_15610 [Morganella morganii]
MDLFSPKPNNKLHRNFKHLIENENLKPVRDVIQSWGEGLLNRKNERDKFINEFQTTFNSSFWELYLNNVFRSMGFCIDYTKESPDFCISTSNGYMFNVEAVVADPPTNITDTEYHEKNFIDNCTIKILGRIKNKLDLYKGTGGKKIPYSSLEHVKNNPFVIAVAPFNSTLSFSQNNVSINQVLFGIDVPKLNDDGNFLVPPKTRIIKPSGAELELGIFTNDSYKEISAVIFSSTGMLGKAIVESGIPACIKATRYRQIYKHDFYQEEGIDNLGKHHHQLTPTHDLFTIRFLDGNFVCGSDMHLCKSNEYSESILDGLHIYFNPYATIPLDPNIFDDYDITHNFYDIKHQECIMEHHDMSLVSRQIIGYDNKE